MRFKVFAAATGLALAAAITTTPAAAGWNPSGDARVIADETGRVTAIVAATGKTLRSGVGGDAATQATRHLRTYAGQFGVAYQAFSVERVTALPGGTSVRFQQHVGGAPVLGAQMVAVLDASGGLVSLHGNVSAAGNREAKPGKKAADVRGKAQRAFAAEAKVAAADLAEEAARLAWFDSAIWAGTPSQGQIRLVWAVKVEPVSLAGFGGEILFDASSGAEVLRMSHKHEINRAICDANGTNVTTSTICLAKNAKRLEGGAVSTVVDVNQAYDYFGSTSTYYQGNFAYDLTANIGSTGRGDNTRRLRAIVRACVPGYGCPMQNAFWNGKGMTFGAGFASADDVVGHELTHGVTEHTSGLVYSSQSGAINESLSDIFGEFTDLSNGLGNDSAGVRWDMGEDLPASIGVIRSMSDPTRFSDPDKVSSTFWYAGTNNSAYVHINSGVGNKAAFLMADGGTFNGQTITGLGLAKAGQIWWRAQNMLTSSATYKELNAVLPASCRALVTAGIGGITSADCAQVDKIVLATEMNLTPAA